MECEEVIKHFMDTKIAFKAICQKLPVIREATKLLHIPFVVTQLLQRPDCTLSDFYGACIEMKERLKIATQKQNKTDLAQCLLHEFENRRHHMINNEAMLSAVYLDRRFAVDLSDRETELAKIALCNLWQRFSNAKKTESPLEPTIQNVETESDDDDYMEFNMSLYLSAKAGEAVEKNGNESNKRNDRTISKDEFLLLLEDYENKFKFIHHKTKILAFWKDQKQQFPEIYEMAKILNGIPPSQATVERAFSALAYIYSPLRCSLSSEMLEDILQIKLNSEILKQIFLEERIELEEGFNFSYED